ncbi:MAG: helix-turn-helix transcriptional regulator, partial [Clostridia bacterium]
KLNIDITNIRRYLRKTSIPMLSNAIKIADYFNCSLDFLFGLENENIYHIFKPTSSFSQCFQTVLAENNCSRYKLHKKTKISDQIIDDWFHGVRVPTIDNIIILAKYFNCSIDYLIGRANY